MFQELKNKKVLFITTKNLDYLRNTQELRLLREQAAQVSVIGVKDKSYPPVSYTHLDVYKRQELKL